MKIKNLLLIVLLGLGVSTLHAQQESHYTQFMYNKLYLNPAFAGAEGFGSFVGIYRNQWMGFEGAPVSQLVSFNTPFFGQRVGFGVVLNHDNIGIMNKWNGALSYSYDLLNRPNAMLRIGFQGSAKYYQMDFSDPNLIISDPADPSIQYNMMTSDVYWNVGAGLYLSVNNFFFGVSAPGLIENVIGYNPNTIVETAAEARHFYAMTGFALPVSNDLMMRSSVLAKYVKHAPIDVDINLSFEFNKRFTTGLSYRVGGDGYGDSVDILLFGQLTRMFGLGLAYDYSLSDIMDSSAGSAEVLLRIDLVKGSDNLKNPRFFY
ncbi:MAG: type IX secretion system membrane protein PorP/SprF [Saprospiraceae bacterium]|nr:type IX secretion system membrane protein PorP/SprF [Saprospiraceae bacterium]